MLQRDQLIVEINAPFNQEEAFDRFLMLSRWWPKAYTWSGDMLVDIGIDPKVGGLLTETGPYEFRCDFGRVLAFERPHRLLFTWQISARREPQLDPARASEVEVAFSRSQSKGTLVKLTHQNFRQHGNDYENYRDAMASEQGWPYLLRAFAS